MLRVLGALAVLRPLAVLMTLMTLMTLWPLGIPWPLSGTEAADGSRIVGSEIELLVEFLEI